MVQKKLSSPISKNTGVWGGVLKNDLQLVYKWGWCKTFIPSPISIKMAVWQPSKKNFLTYMNKNGLLNTLFWKIFTEYLQMSSHNSHRKLETAPLLKNISHLYARKSGFRDYASNRIYIMFTNIPSPIRTKNSRFTGASAIYLHFVYMFGVLSLT